MSQLVKYNREFKLDALNLLQKGKSLSEIFKSLGISVNTLFAWYRSYKLYGNKAFQSPGIRLPKNEQRKNSGLKQERDILKKAVSIFSRKD